MTTCSDLIERTRWHLNTGLYEQTNRLTAPIGTTDTVFSVDFSLNGIQQGAVISMGLELMLVWEVVDASRIITVQRGYGGTLAATHATTDLVTVNPRFSDFHILKALNEDLGALSSMGLYRVGTITFPFNGTIRNYNLAADVIDVLDVRTDSQASTRPWREVDSWQVMRDMPVSEFPSGVSLRLDGQVESQRNVLVRYKRSFGLLSALTDNVETVTGLHSGAIDLPPLGAAIMLGASRDIRRTDTFAQGDTRRSNEVPAGTPQGAVRGLQQQRNIRIGQEQGRLYQADPLRRQTPRGRAG